jgi:TolB protein
MITNRANLVSVFILGVLFGVVGCGQGDNGETIGTIPASGLIAYECESAFDSESLDICVIKPDGSGYDNLESQTTFDQMPAINSNGVIAFVCRDNAEKVNDTRREICTINSDGTGFQILTENVYGEFQPVINSQDRIAFICMIEGFNICAINADGSDNDQLTGAGMITPWVDINNNGQIVFTCILGGDAGQAREICIMNADGTDQTRITNNSTEDNFPTINNNGEIAYICSESSAPASTTEESLPKRICMIDENGENHRFVTSADAPFGQAVSMNDHGDIVYGCSQQICYIAAGQSSPIILHEQASDRWIHPRINNEGIITYRCSNNSICVITADGENYSRLDKKMKDNHPDLSN